MAASLVAASLAPELAPEVGSARATSPQVTIDATFASGMLSAGQGMVVLTQRSGARATLLAGATGTTPKLLAGAGALPSWAHPHVGTDAARRPVIVYPRCRTANVRSCDLYAYDIQAAKERALVGVSAASLGEVEGSMEAGAIAFSRWTRATPPQNGDHGVSTTLLYRARAGAPVRTITRRGGQQIALRRDRILFVRDLQPAYGVCGRPAVQLMRLDGTRRTLRAYRCGMDGHFPMSPTFLGPRIVWAMLSVSQIVFSQWDDARGQVLVQRLPMAAPVAYAPITATRALVLTPQYSTSTPSTTPTWTLVSVSRIAPA